MEYLHSIDVEAEVKDTLSLVGQSATNKASEIYLFSTRTKLFGMVYKAGADISEAMDSSKSPFTMSIPLRSGWRARDWVSGRSFL